MLSKRCENYDMIGKTSFGFMLIGQPMWLGEEIFLLIYELTRDSNVLLNSFVP